MTQNPAAAFVKKRFPRVRITRAGILQAALTLTTPILLCLISVRLVMTPLFLQAVYHLPGFPDDSYGFTLDDRLTYAPYALAYLFNGEDIHYLSDLRLPEKQCVGILFEGDSCSLFNTRELRHMRDVKTVTQYTFGFSIVTGALAILMIFFMWRYRSYHCALRQGLLNGGFLTVGIIAAIVFGVVFNWDFFFNSFHTTFFESGTWRFAYSDTLIRLFPERFWFDAALSVGGLMLGSAGVIILVMLRWDPEIIMPVT